MGSSFTRFRGRGFWSRDACLEVWLFLLAAEAARETPPAEWLSAAAANWRLQATAGFVGSISAGLDEHVSSDDRAELVATIAQRTLARLQAHGPTVGAETLNALGVGGPGSTFPRDVPTARFATVGEAFVRLLRGQLETDAATSPVLPVEDERDPTRR